MADAVDIDADEPDEAEIAAVMASPGYAVVAAWSAAAEKREGYGLAPAEVAALWTAKERKRARKDPKRLKSAEGQAFRMQRLAEWAPEGTLFDAALNAERVGDWKDKIIEAVENGDTTEGEGKKAVFMLSTLLQWTAESKRVKWSLPEADDDGLTWRDYLRLPEGYGKGAGPRPWWGSELAAMFARARGQWIEAAALLALNVGAMQSDFAVIVGTDVDVVGDRTFLTFTRGKIGGKTNVRVTYPLWQETVESLKAVGAWDRVGDEVPLLPLPSGAVPNKDNVNSRHWSPIRKAMEEAGEVRKARGQGDNGFRNLRRTGAQRVYVAAPVASRREIGKAYLQQELIGGAAASYIVGFDSPLVTTVDTAGVTIREAGVFAGDVKRVGAWGREKVTAELATMMMMAAG